MMNPQITSRRRGIAILRVWIRTLRGFRYPGIGSPAEYERILKIFAIYVKYSAVRSITKKECRINEQQMQNFKFYCRGNG